METLQFAKNKKIKKINGNKNIVGIWGILSTEWKFQVFIAKFQSKFMICATLSNDKRKSFGNSWCYQHKNYNWGSCISHQRNTFNSVIVPVIGVMQRVSFLLAATYIKINEPQISTNMYVHTLTRAHTNTNENERNFSWLCYRTFLSCMLWTCVFCVSIYSLWKTVFSRAVYQMICLHTFALLFFLLNKN